jgi:hypothetical protein
MGSEPQAHSYQHEAKQLKFLYTRCSSHSHMLTLHWNSRNAQHLP